jgi:hypothetical protein
MPRKMADDTLEELPGRETFDEFNINTELQFIDSPE